MIISQIKDGVGNQLFRYAAGRRLAHKLNTEFKIDKSEYVDNRFRTYVLNQFNVQENFATPAEVESLIKLREGTDLGVEKIPWEFIPEALNWPDNLYLVGAWEDERYFADIADILRKEFTLKNPLGAAAMRWQKKILAAECSVSLHVCHGDFAYNPLVSAQPSNVILPTDYYYDCVNRLKQYNNPTAFVFSNNLQWCRENLRLNVPTEFVAGNGLTDVEELYLMSLCQHNIIANSTFSWWAAWLNKNPDKKVFMPIPNYAPARIHYRYSPTTIENSLLESDRWTRVTFDIINRPKIDVRPFFSLLLVVNDDAATLAETLESILAQDYKFYELIIIDNASTDGSGKICRQVAKNLDNVTLIRLYDKISNGAAWNKALGVAQGDYVMFLTGNDKIFPDALSSLYMANETTMSEVVNSAVWLEEDARGNIDLGGRKFSIKKDAPFSGVQKDFYVKADESLRSKILSSNAGDLPLASKVFKRKFLLDNAIRFDERIDNAEVFFMTEAMFKADELLFTPEPFYIASGT